MTFSLGPYFEICMFYLFKYIVEIQVANIEYPYGLVKIKSYKSGFSSHSHIKSLEVWSNLNLETLKVEYENYKDKF